jgi:hypothetical protein
LLPSTTGHDTRWGATVGAGLEFGFAPNWSAGIEYDHLFMQDRTYTFADTTGAFFSTERIRQDVDLVTVRVAGAVRSSRSTDRDLIQVDFRARAGSRCEGVGGCKTNR